MNLASEQPMQTGNEMSESESRVSEAPVSYRADVWRRLTPGERLRRSWQMRSRLPELKGVHGRKLFPKV